MVGIGPHLLQKKNPADLSFKLLIQYYYNLNGKSYNWVFPIEADDLRHRLGRRYSKEEREAMSRGRIGMKFSKTHIRNLSLSHIGKRLSEEQNERRIRAALKACMVKPNKPESFLIRFLQANFPNEWKYVGNGEVMIARKNPDFININGQKKIIEFNGFYTHTKEEESERGAIFSGYGFKTLFLHYPDLEDEGKLKQTIQEFVLGGDVES